MDPQETKEILETKVLLVPRAPWDPMVILEHRLVPLYITCNMPLLVYILSSVSLP